MAKYHPELNSYLPELREIDEVSQDSEEEDLQCVECGMFSWFTLLLEQRPSLIGKKSFRQGGSFCQEDPPAILTSGKVRVKVGARYYFQHLKIENNGCLTIYKGLDPFSALSLELSRVLKVLTFPDEDESRRLAFFEAERGGGLRALHLEFERKEELEMLLSWVKKTQVLKKRPAVK